MLSIDVCRSSLGRMGEQIRSGCGIIPKSGLHLQLLLHWSNKLAKPKMFILFKGAGWVDLTQFRPATYPGGAHFGQSRCC